MITLVDTAPHVDVEPAEYARLLGYPPGRVLEDRAAELGAWARDWYTAHGRPWVIVRGTERLSMNDTVGSTSAEPCVTIEGASFAPARLHGLLARTGAHGVVLAAMSAGEELEAEAQRLWQDEKPDEYFFLEMYGSAVVEHLAMRTGARLCAWAEAQGMAVLPHDSPGYAGWDIAEGPALLPLVANGLVVPGPLRALESGALMPKKSLLAVYGLTRQLNADGRLTSLVPCEHCTLARCQYRRRPYVWSRSSTLLSPGASTLLSPGASDAPEQGEDETLGGASTSRSRAATALTGNGAGPALRSNATSRTSRKALQRWARERLTMSTLPDGGVNAQFRYDGTTCTNMGRELTFMYDVTLGPRDDGYPIREQRCAPAPGDTGHTAMCGYIRDGTRLISAIAAERPLVGLRLDDVLSWARPTSASGCYCDASSREHKWGLVLETIHFALVERERS
jgi:hypothetical protein